MDIFERRPRAAAADEAEAVSVPRRGRAKRNKAMPLAMLNAGALDTPTGLQQRPPSIFAVAAAPATAAAASSRSSAAKSSVPVSSSLPPRPPYSAAHAPATSVALVFRFLPLRSFLMAARSCRSWSTAARSRTAWADGRQWVSVRGNREELRQRGTAAEEEEIRARNFNPNDMHSTPTDQIVRGSSTAASAGSASAPTESPLLRACSTPLLLNLRHLRYRFASPSIRTAIAALDSEDMYTTSAVVSQFPLCGLPAGALPFLASLALDDVTTCSQATLQSAFASLGVQAHSHLRALRIQSNPVLSGAETLRTFRAVLAELPANLLHLEVLHLPQRNLPAEVALEPLLSLARLHTLVLDASCTKTPARLQVVRGLSLHGQLRHLKWPLWRPDHVRQMFGGVRYTCEEEEALTSGMATLTTTSGGGGDGDGDDCSRDHLASDPPAPSAVEEEESILGLDDEENDLAAATAAGSSSSLSGATSFAAHSAGASFRFESWTLDGGVSAANFSLYFGAQPSLLPNLHTLSFVQANNFASFVPMLPSVLSSLPALTALRVQVPYFSLGPDFFTQFAGLHLPQLKRLQLDQVSLVLAQPSAGARGGGDDVVPSSPSTTCLWRSFPGLEELALLNLVLPSSESFAESMPLLRRVELHNVSAGAGAASGNRTAPPMQQWLRELARLPLLSHLFLLHCADVDVESLSTLAHSPTLESLHFRPHSERHGHAHSSSHAHPGSRTGDHAWEDASLRHFDSIGAEEDAQAGAAAAASTRAGGAMQRQHSGSSRIPSGAHAQLLALQQRQLQLQLASRRSSPDSVRARMSIHYADESGQLRALPALPDPHAPAAPAPRR